jgi:aldose sugar dehydrogenase
MPVTMCFRTVRLPAMSLDSAAMHAIKKTLLLLGLVVPTALSGEEAQGVRFETEVIVSDLKAPTSLVFLPGGRALLAERRSARVSLLDLATKTLTPLTPDFAPGVLTGEDAGIHDLALHPDHARNGWIYMSYSSGTEERSTLAIDRFVLDGARVTKRERIFSASKAQAEDRFHYGGRMVFAKGFLFVSSGERHNQARAQELSSHQGKILRLHDDGRAPADNPFVGQDRALPEIWTYGHRNIQGLAVHPVTGEIWANEHGPRHGDELNLIKRGANYGWPVVSYGWEYSGGPIGMGITRQDGMEPPVWVWTPAIAPSGMFVYTGEAFPAWRGSFFIGSMGRTHLNRLALVNGQVVLEERILLGKAGRARLVAQGPDGFIYYGNDNGQLVRIRPAR